MLKAKIVKGELFVDRDGEFFRQICPRTADNLEDRSCNYECPLFGEVVSHREIEEDKSTGEKKITRGEVGLLTICENKTFEVVE